MNEQREPRINDAIDGVWASHKGMAADQVISVLHEAVKSAGGDLPEDEYRRIGFEIANGTYH